MAIERKDSVADTSTTTGTGTLTLAGSAPAGRLTFAASGLTTGATVRYRISLADESEWEVGEGIWTSSGATLTRVEVFKSSNSGSLVNFSAGTKNVALVMTAADLAVYKFSAYMNTATNSTTAGWQKALVDTVSFDTGSWWDSTNKRVIPNKPGYYQVTARSRFGTTGIMSAGIGLNGALALVVGTDAGSAQQAAGGTAIIYCNGSTDYIENWAFSSTVRAFTTGAVDTYLQVHGPI